MSGGWKAEREGAAHHDDEEIRHSGESRNPGDWTLLEVSGSARRTYFAL